MMRRIILTLICLGSALAQEHPESPSTFAKGWKQSLVGGLTLTQVAFKDWAQGGENALSWTVSAEGKSTYEQMKLKWSNSYKLALGHARLGSQGLRKTEDRIEIETVMNYKLGRYVSPYGAATLKTQFAKGFVYGASGEARQVSQFFDPAYLTQTLGMGYQPLDGAKTRLGIGLREVITRKFNQYTDDPRTPEVEKITLDGGIESVSNFEVQFDENILLTSQLELFAPLKKISNTILRSNATLSAKFNKYLSAILNLQVVNEPRISPHTQLKESIALGLSYTIF